MGGNGKGEWRERTQYVAPDAMAGDDLGTSVAVSGSRVAGGAMWKDFPTAQNAGAVYVLTPESFGESYGTGCPGTGGVVPGLRADGCPSSGTLELRIYDALGPSFGQLLFGAIEGSAPISGTCDLLVSPLLPVTIPFDLAGFGPGAGEFVLTTTIPPTLPAATLTMQAAIFDPFGAPGFAVTNGLELTFP